MAFFNFVELHSPFVTITALPDDDFIHYQVDTDQAEMLLELMHNVMHLMINVGMDEPQLQLLFVVKVLLGLLRERQFTTSGLRTLIQRLSVNVDHLIEPDDVENDADDTDDTPGSTTILIEACVAGEDRLARMLLEEFDADVNLHNEVRIQQHTSIDNVDFDMN